MPLSSGTSKKSFEKNLKTEVAAGKPKRQALAIAYAQQRRNGGKDAEPSPAAKALAAGKREAAALKAGNPKAALKANRAETVAEKAAIAKAQGQGSPIKAADLARRQRR